MESFASAYARVLFPRRYGPRDRVVTHDHPRPGARPMGLEADDLEITLSAAIYHAVEAVERLLDTLRRLPVRWRARSRPGAGTRPVGCT